MKLTFFFLQVLFVCSTAPLFSQVDSAMAKTDIQTWADVRKSYFKTTKDDSLFVTLNSDGPFEYTTYSRAELTGVMEGMFFNANVGDVLGPLFIDNYAMIFKVARYDSTFRTRASHIYIKPDGNSRRDTLRAVKKANEYLEKIKKGEDFSQLATKYSQDETAQTGGDLGYLWEGGMLKEFEDAIANANKGDVFVVKTPIGAHVVKVTEDKIIDRGKVVLIPVVKKM